MGGGGRDGHRHCFSHKPPVGVAVALLCGGGGGTAHHCCCSSGSTIVAVPRVRRRTTLAMKQRTNGLASWGLAPLSRSPLDLGM